MDGTDEEITPVAGEITSLEVTDSLVDSQATSIALTVVAALIVLVLFFWVTEFRPMLAVLGFGVLVFSPIPPMGQFGLLTAIAVAYSLIAAVVVLPPMLVTWAAYHQWRRQIGP